ncbi:MAG: hypothetical protein IRY85_21620 [Micromonosporaceae bacterium]|nr:hypothetical protein [Micromonosporaceae bacterium]
MAASLLFVATGCGSKEVTQPPLAGELVATVAGGSGKIVKVAWSPTGYLATADADAVTVWNTPATEPIRTFSDLYGGMLALRG